ncbi:hypothetical protein Tco_0711535 [Tanacetum coccineum]
MTRMMYNWIMKRKLDPRENSDRGVSNFKGRIKGMHAFIGNFTYIIDFMIVEDISSIIDPRLSQVVLGRPFIEISNMTYDPPEGVTWKKSTQNRSTLGMRKTKEEEWSNVMNKILGFYKECLELGPEYATGMDDEGEVTKFLIKNEEEIFIDAGDGIKIYPDGVASPTIQELLEYIDIHNNDASESLQPSWKVLEIWKSRKAHLLEDKQIPSVGVFDEVFSTWMTFGGNTRDLGSFGEETDKITDLHQIHEEVLFTERGDGVAGIKRRRRDLSSDGVRDLATASADLKRI